MMPRGLGGCTELPAISTEAPMAQPCTERLRMDVYLDWYRASKGKSVMNFGQAIEALKLGKRVARSGWNGKGMWLSLQRPDAHSKMTLPYIYMFTADNQLVPWLASQTDVLSEDWGEVA